MATPHRFFRISLAFCLSVCLPVFLLAQNTPVSFNDQSTLLPQSFFSGAPIGVADMNGDGKDDIVHLHNRTTLWISYQNSPNQLFTSQNYGVLNSGSEWSLCIADIDQNGINDILAGGSYNNLKLVTGNALQQFTTSLLSNSNIFLQGSNFADINNDGWIDIFACHDDGDSRKYRNDGTGGFVMDNGMLNTTTTPASDNSGNYASIWTDYDNDGDLDMYLSKCRLGVSSPTDPRRVNKLFQNDGNNVYTDVASAAGLMPLTQTWTTDFADVDNDGDLDAFINNHGANCLLMINNGNGTFTDQTSASGLLPTLGAAAGLLGIQAIFRDFNNDGFVDLLYSGEKHYLFYNDGDGTFTVASNPFSSADIHSFALGDLNHDGFVDVYAGHGSGYNGVSSSVTDDLFLNNGNSNHWVAVQLVGTQSNRNGIGARVEIYGAWGKQIREVRSGEGYGIMNTFTQHFGLGAATAIDSIVVRWPSGLKDKVPTPAIDQYHQITENDVINANFVADKTTAFPAPALISFDASATSNPAGGTINYAWDFGDGSIGSGVSPSHTFVAAGTYRVKLTVTDINTQSDADSLYITVGNSIDDFPALDTDKDNDGIPDSLEVLSMSWVEDFVGLSDNTISDNGPTAWSLTLDNDGTTGVNDNEDRLIFGGGTPDIAELTTEVIPVGGFAGRTFEVKIDWARISANIPDAPGDFFQIFVQVDGTETLVYEQNTTWPGQDVAQTYTGSFVANQDIRVRIYSDISATVEQFAVSEISVTSSVADLDGDNQIHALDLDSDNDGIWDVVEAGGTDSDGDGFIDNAASLQGSLTSPPDTDNDGIPDFLDRESTNPLNDGTGPFDIASTTFRFFDTNQDGTIDANDTDGGKDNDLDGLDDLIDGNLAEKGAGIIGAGICLPTYSVARKWNEVLLEGIRGDYARPTVHARNLHHIAGAMYDAWSAYESQSLQYFLGNTLHGFSIPFTGVSTVSDSVAAQEEAMSYAAYRLIRHRFGNSPGRNHTLYLAFLVMHELGYDPEVTGLNYAAGGPAELGNYIADRVIAYGFQDNANEADEYENLYYSPANPFLEIEESGNPTLIDPNRWQPLAFDVFIDQSGNVTASTVPDFLSPEWGKVKPFSLKGEDLSSFTRDGETYQVYHDPGSPPYLDTLNLTTESELYKWAFSMVATWSAHLDPADSVKWDISPASIGNIPFDSLPGDFADYNQFYDYLDGGVIGQGRTLNPVTNAPYQPQVVPRGDYARVLAEFWADGPDSETPPGHWFTLLNYVNDNPLLVKKWRGEGATLSDLEWDIKGYFTLGGTMHDAAITAWGIKGWYDYIRPVSAIRYMARRGQSSDPLAMSYDPGGLPLVPGVIELVQLGDALAGPGNVNVGKIKIYGWKGPNYILNPETDEAGVDWILADDWWPYQRPSFVTPPFAGYVSGHSTYSRAAAEVLTYITGDEYFPGGMGEFLAPKNEFLVFEEGPSRDIRLQWATYQDASDECSLSRIWGGIHPPLDDIPGRIMGRQLGVDGFVFSDSIFQGSKALLRLKALLEGPYDGAGGMNSFLADNALLSATDPYGLGLTASNAVMSQSGPLSPVDWMRIELRSGDDSTQVMAQTAALILRNGTLVSPGGDSLLTLNASPADAYYVVLQHYNHLGVMTAAPYPLLTTQAFIDFSDPTTGIYTQGGSAMKNASGKLLLWSGDANGDGSINAVDKNSFWQLENGQPYQYGINQADFNLDGVINAADLNGFWRVNNSRLAQLP